MYGVRLAWISGRKVTNFPGELKKGIQFWFKRVACGVFSAPAGPLGQVLPPSTLHPAPSTPALKPRPYTLCSVLSGRGGRCRGAGQGKCS